MCVESGSISNLFSCSLTLQHHHLVNSWQDVLAFPSWCIIWFEKPALIKLSFIWFDDVTRFDKYRALLNDPYRKNRRLTWPLRNCMAMPCSEVGTDKNIHQLTKLITLAIGKVGADVFIKVWTHVTKMPTWPTHSRSTRQDKCQISWQRFTRAIYHQPPPTNDDAVSISSTTISWAGTKYNGTTWYGMVAVGVITVLYHFHKKWPDACHYIINDKHLVRLYNTIFSYMTGILSHLSYIFC